jgi:N-acylneuraminate cytidylyltransferase
LNYIIEPQVIAAIIPARGGSKGVPRKNIKPLGGVPLLAYSIAAAQLSNYISRAIVSTDDEEIAEIAKRFHADVPFMRPAEFATDAAGDYEVIRHAIDWLGENEGIIPGYFVHLRPTTPLREIALVDEAIRMFCAVDGFTSLRSAHPAPESPYKWFRMKGKDQFQSFIPNLSNEDINHDRRSYPTAYVPDGYVDIIKTEQLLATGMVHGEKMMAYISPDCTEVDTLREFELLEYELAHKGSELYDFLKHKYMEENLHE